MNSKQFGAISTTATLALVFLISGCSVDGEWWPLFNICFLITAALPPMFGATESDSIWGAIGDFVIASLLVSMFAFPLVLYHAAIITGGAVTLVILSNLMIIATLVLVVYFQNSDYSAIF